ncbi:MAG: thymidylate synthase [Methylomicrobium sp.]|nr:thymidylate synthase [Methylomicrobium sp.]
MHSKITQDGCGDYYNLLEKIMKIGNNVDKDRTGTGTVSLFGEQMRFNLEYGFPLVTGKFVSFRTIAAELLWMLSGSTNNEDLRKLNGTDRPTIWEEWSLPGGELGPIYGNQWRQWQGVGAEGIDQIKKLISDLRLRPFSRRHIISAWNVDDLPDESAAPQDNASYGLMALAPCHCLFQFYVRELESEERIALANADEEWRRLNFNSYDNFGVPRFALSCQLYMRSSDLFLGSPYNIASYALLTHIIAQIVGMAPEQLIVTIGDSHIYRNHFDQVNELLSRDLNKHPASTLIFNRKITDIDDISLDDFEVVGYQSHAAIAAPVAI